MDVFTQKILTRIREELSYPDANKLSSETLWQTCHWRFDLLQFILTNFFHNPSPNVYFPATLIEQLVNSHNNDEREHILLQCFSYLALVKTNDRSIISGECGLEENYKFMNQLLNLAKINRASLRSFEQSAHPSFSDHLSRTLEKDAQFINGIAHQQAAVFDTPVRLFSQDILSRLADEPIPSFSYLEDYMTSTEQQTRIIAEQVYQIEQKLNNRKSEKENLDSVELVRDLSTQFVTIEKIAAEIHSELTDLQFLTKKFTDIYTTDVSTWIQREKQKSMSTAEQREQQTAQILGESARRVLTNFKKVKTLLANLQSIQQSYLQIITEHEDSNVRQLSAILIDNKFSEDRVNKLLDYSRVLQESTRRNTF